MGVGVAGRVSVGISVSILVGLVNSLVGIIVGAGSCTKDGC